MFFEKKEPKILIGVQYKCLIFGCVLQKALIILQIFGSRKNEKKKVLYEIGIVQDTCVLPTL